MFFIKEEEKIKSVVNSCVNENHLELCLEWIKSLSYKMTKPQKESLNNEIMNKWTEIELIRVNGEKHIKSI